MHTMPRGRRRIVGIRAHCRWIGHLARGDSHIGWPENEIGVALMRLQDALLLVAAMGDVRVNVTETAPSAATVYLSGDIDHGPPNSCVGRSSTSLSGSSRPTS